MDVLADNRVALYLLTGDEGVARSGKPQGRRVVDDFNTPTLPVATVNYSVPDDVKRLFNETFADHNRSAIVADLMLRAVEDHRQQVQSAQAVDRLLARRAHRPAATAAAVRAAREAGRP